MKLSLTLAFFIATLMAAPTFADLVQGSCSADQTTLVTTRHSVTIAGKTITYLATAGFKQVTSNDGKERACLFYTAYTEEGTPATAPRPITFAFNGGPGSASFWLHLGGIGPRRVDMGPEGLTPPSPFRLEDNADSLLDLSDLVLIDPVATGFSSTEDNGANDPFFGAKNDYKSIADFIQGYLNENNRWSSAKYVLGESYGGVRGSLLAHHLQTDYGINLAGVILVSPWLSTTTTNFGESDNDLPYVLFLPSYATTAWYHNRIAPQYQRMSAEDVLAFAESFARGTYWNALQMGNDLSDADFHSVAKEISDLTGIPEETVEEQDLRITDSNYFPGLLADQDKVVGRLDSRFVTDKLPGGLPTTDPTEAIASGPFTAAINYYLRTELNVQTPMPYVTSADIEKWPYDSDGEEFGVMNDLDQALIENPSLHIYVASGLYDLAVPYESVRYNFEHLSSKALSARVTISRFPSGHMIYINPVALTKFKTELSAFFSTTNRNSTDLGR